MVRFLPLAMLLCLLSSGGLLHGQTADDMDELLESREITWAQACRFVLPAAGALEADTGAEAAFDAAREKGWLPRGAEAAGSVSLGGLSHLALGAFSFKKSLLYALFPGPRYAYRQMDYLGLLPGLRDPAQKVSGERLLQVIGRVLSCRGDEDEPAPEKDSPAVSAARREQREEMVREITAELDARNVKDTTVRVVEEGVAISLNNIQFMPDDAELTEPERIKLMRVAVILTRYPDRKILVEGHTAPSGTPEGRLQVSTRRAQAVADFLVYLDSRRPEDISVRGYGAERPLSAGGTAEEQARNRRVEITILDE